MDRPKSSSSTGLTPRSRRSRTNLSDLRLAPLSQKYTQPSRESAATKSPQDNVYDTTFTRSHPSYISGKSAPTSPGILSRSSSRRHLQVGWSRRGSLHENEGPEDVSYEYAGSTLGDSGALRRDIAAGVPKAQSDAALLPQRNKLAEKDKQARAQKLQLYGKSYTGGATTPTLRKKNRGVDDDWFTRTGATANAILQESKGQSWLASRPSAATLTQLQDTTDEEDEGYEEMAAQSTRNSKRRTLDEEISPVSTRASRWGSRYGSRTASRRTSRRGSMSGLNVAESRTPLAGIGQDGAADIFDQSVVDGTEPQFLDEEEKVEERDDEVVAGMVQNRSFGLGGLVDRVMGLNIFNVEEREESTEEENEIGRETEAQAKVRMAKENQRKREEKEKLVNRRTQQDGDSGDANDGNGEGGWSDAAWLLSVASKAIF